MDSREEFEMMKSDPRGLYLYYINIVINGETLSEEQIVKFEYCKKMLGL